MPTILIIQSCIFTIILLLTFLYVIEFKSPDDHAKKTLFSSLAWMLYLYFLFLLLIIIGFSLHYSNLTFYEKYNSTGVNNSTPININDDIRYKQNEAKRNIDLIMAIIYFFEVIFLLNVIFARFIPFLQKNVSVLIDPTLGSKMTFSSSVSFKMNSRNKTASSRNNSSSGNSSTPPKNNTKKEKRNLLSKLEIGIYHNLLLLAAYAVLWISIFLIDFSFQNYKGETFKFIDFLPILKWTNLYVLLVFSIFLFGLYNIYLIKYRKRLHITNSNYFVILSVEIILVFMGFDISLYGAFPKYSYFSYEINPAKTKLINKSREFYELFRKNHFFELFSVFRGVLYIILSVTAEIIPFILRYRGMSSRLDNGKKGFRLEKLSNTH